jgi:hypothetical protein
MKLKAKKSVKPWDDISIDEILPYNPKYTKMIILSYISIAFFIFENTNFLGVSENILFLGKYIVYGILAFSLLYLFEDGNLGRMLNAFISITLVLVVISLLLNTFLFVINGSGFLGDLIGLDLPIAILGFVLIILDAVLVIIAAFLGPLNLIVTDHPKVQKHGAVIVVVFYIFIFLSWILHII